MAKSYTRLCKLRIPSLTHSSVVHQRITNILQKHPQNTRRNEYLNYYDRADGEILFQDLRSTSDRSKKSNKYFKRAKQSCSQTTTKKINDTSNNRKPPHRSTKMSIISRNMLPVSKISSLNNRAQEWCRPNIRHILGISLLPLFTRTDHI